MRCTKVIDFKGPEPIFCAKPAVLQINEDHACEEHAPELAQLSDVPWHPRKEEKK